MTGICHVIIWSKLGARRPVRFTVLLLERSLWMLARPSRWDDKRCRRTVWSAALMMDRRERMMPQYHAVRTNHGDCFPLVRIVGQLPVEVSTPARRAA
jgi:hypothetical protein